MLRKAVLPLVPLSEQLALLKAEWEAARVVATRPVVVPPRPRGRVVAPRPRCEAEAAAHQSDLEWVALILESEHPWFVAKQIPSLTHNLGHPICNPFSDIASIK